MSDAGLFGGLALDGAPAQPTRATPRRSALKMPVCLGICRDGAYARCIEARVYTGHECRGNLLAWAPERRSPMTEPSTRPTPKRLADFEIVRRLGAGGMAEVFLAKKRGA